MPTNLFIIVTPTDVYATYYRTICHKANYTDAYSKSSAINEAMAIAFSYGLTFGNVNLGRHETHKMWGDKEVFEFLEKNNP